MSTHHTRMGIARLAGLVALVMLAAFAAAGVARAATSYVYTDATGDSLSAPDIQKVILTDNSDGTVGVEIDLAAAIPSDGSAVVLGIDADRNAQTGQSDSGWEYVVIAQTDGVALGKWDGSEWSSFVHAPLNPNLVGGTLTFTLTLSDLGVTSFDFVVGGTHGNDVDIAPENGVFTYPQTVPATPVTVTIQGVILSANLMMPKAGKTFAVPSIQVQLSNNTIVAVKPTACTLSYRGKKLAPVKACTWKLPKTVKGKTLTLRVTVSYASDTRTIDVPVLPR